MNSALFDIEEELKKLPAKPGVYIMHDKDDEIIYVGKAVILKNRVRSYFRESTTKTLKISTMVSKVAWFEYVVTDSELEALVLENNLIKENQPKYNTLLKDDKTYPYIKVTIGEDYPRIFLTRKVRKDNAKYYGPYTSAGAVKDTIELLCKLYKIRTCSHKYTEDEVYNGSAYMKANADAETEINTEKDTEANITGISETGTGRACLYYHINQCQAPCLGLVSRDEYRKSIQGALDFLNGNYRPLINELTAKMNEQSEALEFEEAAATRDLIESVSAVAQKQKITDTGGEDKDIIAMAREGDSVIIQVFFVRDGKIIGREHYYMKHTEQTENEEIIRNFVMQFYAGTPYIPRELIIPVETEDMDLCAEWLSEKRGSRVKLTVPVKGKKEKLVELAEKNAQIVLRQDIEKLKREKERTEGAMNELMDLLNIEGISRMEAYDISNISGYDSVGSMVVYEEGRPKKNDYRKFRIKSVEGPNDYASMNEVLTRRFRHGLTERSYMTEADENRDSTGKTKWEAARVAEQAGYGRFSKFPDLILMDGGRGQVNIAEQVLDDLGLSIPVCGMVKDDNHRTRGLYYNNIEIPISRNSEAFKLITRVQDEAHRFAIEFHRSLRSKGQVHSVLDDIEGIGEKRRRALMKSFASIEEIKAADIERLMEVPSMDRKSARSVYDFFRK
ncbi:MAG: excinuclease ABC subunit UvrC [Lachnospiraceae bacterium]|nr:excinuclease ABC subunit UvrC [Lachnospiraceae bacterium]